MADKQLAIVTMPDGTRAAIYGPEDASQEEILRRAQAAKAAWQPTAPARPATPKIELPKDNETIETPQNLLQSLNGFLGKNISEPALAIFDLGKTILSGALGTVAGGVAGAGRVITGGFSEDFSTSMAAGADWFEQVQDLITLDLYTEPGKRLAQHVEQQLEKKSIPIYWYGGKKRISPKEFKAAADDAILEVAAGNPAIAAAVKTVVYGAPDIYLGRVPFKHTPALETAKAISKRSQSIKNNYDEMLGAAEKSGYKLTNDDLAPSIVQVADAMAPERHAAVRLDELATNVAQAKKASKQAVDQLYETARSKKAVIDILPIQERVASLDKRLIERGFDVSNMSVYQRRLSDFKNLNWTNKRGTAKTVSLNQLNTLERRITNDLRGKKRGEYTSEDVALLHLRSQIRSHMDDVFNRGAITGDPEAVTAWTSAREAASTHAKRFKADKIIRDLVEKDASPEEIYRWIMGASAMSAKKQATRTLRRLKEILGPDHPTIITIRTAVLRDVLKPAFQDVPNLDTLMTNIDKLLLDNPSIVKELNIPIKELELMKRAAHAANQARPPFKDWVNRSWLTRTGASVIFGHQIARKGAIVRSAHKIMDMLAKTGQLTKAEILKHMNELDYTSPAVVPKSPLWADIMVRGAAADLADQNDEEDEFE